MPQGKVLLARLGLAALLLTVLPHAERAYADTFTVTTTQDAPHAQPIDGTCTSTLPGGTCTLRAAIQAIDYLTGGPHTVNLQAAGTYLLSVTGASEELAATGDLDLNNVQVMINNTSGGAIALDGNQIDRVFDVGPNASAQLTLSNVTVQNGKASGNGGGIRVNGGSTLSASAVDFSGNTAFGAAEGGGLHVAGSATATLTNVSFSGNAAGSGGAVSGTLGQVIVTHGTFTNNVGGNFGGAIYAQTQLNDVTVSNNQTRGLGGGIYGAGNWTNVTLTGNTADRGGGAYYLGGTWTNVNVTGNSATTEGGGVSQVSLTMNGGSFSNNTAPSGGAIEGRFGPVWQLTNVTLENNSAARGGAINSDAPLALTNVAVTGNAATEYGGGIGATNSITASNVNISHNTSTNGPGGGIYFVPASGAGIYVTLTDVAISNNSAGAGNGGGIVAGNSLRFDSFLFLTRVSVVNNVAQGGAGGGIFGYHATGNFSDVTISGNTASGHGGGLDNENGQFTVNRGVLSSNTTTGGNGGGINNIGSTSLTNVTLNGNATSGSGGGINNGGSTSLTNVTMSGNTAGTTGGGVSTALATLSAAFTNVTFSGNGAAPSSGGAVFNAGVTNVKNTIVANSPTGGNCAGPVRMTSQGDNLISDATCNLTSPGDRNNTNPQLGPLADNGGATLTHALLPGSPAIDAVIHNACPPPATDQRGITRPRGVACDIGAYEAPPQPTPTPTPTLTPVVLADLAITKSASPDSPRVGTNLNYLVTVSNNGPGAATGVTVTDNLPSGARFISARPSQGACGGPPQVVCALGSLAVGGSATINVVIQPTQSGVMTNGASVTGNQQDPNAGNNAATVTNTAQAASCPTRPPVQVSVQPLGGGRLQATLSVSTDSNVPTNQFHGYASGRVTNTLVDIPGGPTGVTSFGGVPPPGTQQLVFIVRQVDPSQGASVEIAVTDDCGDWPTFIGGGPPVFQGGGGAPGGAAPSAPTSVTATPRPAVTPTPTATPRGR
jgi:uncharacterized repeat protein (TIGR01451 family)/CSLREA domain-containing protein